MKVTWYKGSKLGSFDDQDKELVAKMLKKGWSPNKLGAKKVELPKGGK